MQNMHSWARTQLTRTYKEEYRNVYSRFLEERTRSGRSKAQNKAKTFLVFKYRFEYKKLCREAQALGFPRK